MKITDKQCNKQDSKKYYISYFSLNPRIIFDNKKSYIFQWKQNIATLINKNELEEDVHYGFRRKIEFVKNINTIVKTGAIDREQEKLLSIGQLYIDGYKWMIFGKQKRVDVKYVAFFPTNSMSIQELLVFLTISFSGIFILKEKNLVASKKCNFLEYIKWLSSTNGKYVAEYFTKMYNNKEGIGIFDRKSDFKIFNDSIYTNIKETYVEFADIIKNKEFFIDDSETFSIYKLFYIMESFFGIDLFLSNFMLQRLQEAQLIKLDNAASIRSNIVLSNDIKDKFVLYIKLL